ncbi:MAG TPA: hypothetical protein VIT45_06350 [Allosphingosinicella sp.]
MKMNLIGAARFAAAAGALAIAGFGLGGPGIAHPHGEEDGAVTKTEKVIILREGDSKHDGKGKRLRTFHVEGDGKAGDGRRIRTVHIGRDGKAGEGERHVRVMRFGEGALHDCDGEEVARSETGGENDKTKVIICSKDQLTQAQRIEKIEKVLTRIQSNDELSAEHKEKVTAALRRAIEDMRTTP